MLYQTYPEIAATLRDRPGTWFLIGHGYPQDYRMLTQVAYRIRKSQIRDFRDGKWEARIQTTSKSEVLTQNQIKIRRNIPQRVEVYARFLSD